MFTVQVKSQYIVKLQIFNVRPLKMVYYRLQDSPTEHRTTEQEKNERRMTEHKISEHQTTERQMAERRTTKHHNS
jgi:hypothetical protein